MILKQSLRAAFFLGLASSVTFGLKAHHNGTRYFPFLEKPEEIVIKKHSHIAPEFFYLKASTAHKRGGGNFGIPELWGRYDLKDVLTSLEAIQGAAVANQIRNMLAADLRDKSIKFKTHSNMHAQGLALGYEQDLKWNGFSIGAWVPVMHVSSLGRFHLELNNNNGIDGVGRSLIDAQTGELNAEGHLIDKVRRTTHDKLGFIGNTWDGSGFGDIDLHLRWNYFMDHQLLMRSVDSYIQVGLILPTGMTIKNNEPLSIPAMGNGHWGAYFDVVPEFELKQDWKLGFMVGGLYQFKDTTDRRIPVGNEPVVYSALTGRVEVQPGITAKISPYFTLENLTDGVHFQMRYTYLRHGIDKWYDKRADKTTPSYLDHANSAAGLTPEQITQNIRNREVLSKWRSHFFSFHLMYDAKQALQKWGMNPLLYVTYDLPISGSNIAKTHQLSLGAQLHF